MWALQATYPVQFEQSKLLQKTKLKHSHSFNESYEYHPCCPTHTTEVQKSDLFNQAPRKKGKQNAKCRAMQMPQAEPRPGIVIEAIQGGGEEERTLELGNSHTLEADVACG